MWLITLFSRTLSRHWSPLQFWPGFLLPTIWTNVFNTFICHNNTSSYKIFKYNQLVTCSKYSLIPIAISLSRFITAHHVLSFMLCFKLCLLIIIPLLRNILFEAIICRIRQIKSGYSRTIHMFCLTTLHYRQMQCQWGIYADEVLAIDIVYSLW